MLCFFDSVPVSLKMTELGWEGVLAPKYGLPGRQLF